MRSLFIICGVMALSACPPQVSLSGKLCDDAGACPDGMRCIDGVCRGPGCDQALADAPCSVGIGACARTGTWDCVNDTQLCGAVPGTPQPEVCNGLDDDCDGVVDDAPTDLGARCDAGLGQCAQMGQLICDADAGALACSAAPLQSVPELCNGLDDDCDGFVDDGCLSTLVGGGPPADVDGEASSARFSRPTFLSSDATGRVFVADTFNHQIRMVDGNGRVSTIAGTGRCGFTDGPGASATFCAPWDVEVLPNGDLYVSDNENHAIRLIRNPLSQPMVETVFADAGLLHPRGISLSLDGGLLVADTGRHRVKFITRSGIQLIGSGLVGAGEATWQAVPLNSPGDVVECCGGGVLIVSEAAHRLRRIPLDGLTPSTTAAGTGNNGYAEGTGPGARLYSPLQLALDADAGRVYFVDSNNHLVRSMTTDDDFGSTRLVSGAARVADLQNGAPGRLLSPLGVTRVPGGLVVSDSNARLRRISFDADGGPSVLSDFAGGLVSQRVFDNALASQASLGAPTRLELWPPNGISWIEPTLNLVRLRTSDGRVVTLVTGGSNDAGPMDGPLGQPSTRLINPQDLKAGPGGKLYVADYDANRVRVIDPQLTRIDTFIGPNAELSSPLNRPTAIAFGKSPGGADVLYVADSSPVALRRFELDTRRETVLAGRDAGIATSTITALLADDQGTVYYGDNAGPSVRRIDWSGKLIAQYANGETPRALDFDDGRVVMTTGATRVFVLNPDGGASAVFDGARYSDNHRVQGNADGPPGVGTLWAVWGLRVADGRYYLLDTGSNRVRVMVAPR